MALAEALQKASLRRVAASTAASNNASPAAPSLATGVAMERERNARLRACDLNAWYDRLAGATYKTRFVPLSPEEARALIASYAAKRAEQHAERNTSLLAALQQRIAAAIAELGGGDVFAKLSSRSAKDSRFCEARALERVKAQLLAVRSAGGAVDTNAVLSACLGCGIQALRLSSAAEVIECFTTSERVCADDLPLALEFPASWAQFVVLREWVTIPSSHEFRAFVVGNRLTALSQYFSGAYYPDLVENKERILALVLRFFETQVRDQLAMQPPDYVIDFAVDPGAQRAYVIEINPFGRPDGYGTGTPLFDLREAHDRAVLFGDAPFEFRVETAPPPASAMAALLRDGALKTWLMEQRMIPGGG